MTRTTEPRLALAIGAVLLTTVVGTRTQAQEAAPSRSAEEVQRAQAELDRTPTDCVIISRVDRNVAASNSQVVFFMKGGTYYLNVLDGACQALSKGDEYLVFQYRTRSARLTRLCDSDGFTVERQTSRVGCALGQFFPITAEEAAALTAKAAAAPAASN
jgi:predicted methyltransferase